MVGDPYSQPPLGWRPTDGLLKPDLTVAGYLARGQEIKGRCHLRGCRRTCHIDVDRLASKSLGGMPVEWFKRFYRCMRPEGCALDFHDESSGLRIRALLGYPHVRIRFRCEACKFFRTALPDQVLAKLAAKGSADDATIEDLTNWPMEPCKSCGKTAWRVDVLWPNPDSEGMRLRR